jgi:hypothetical protein
MQELSKTLVKINYETQVGYKRKNIQDSDYMPWWETHCVLHNNWHILLITVLAFLPSFLPSVLLSILPSFLSSFLPSILLSFLPSFPPLSLSFFPSFHTGL